LKELAAARKAGGPTLAVAVYDLSAVRMAGAWLGPTVNADELVALAEEAYTAAPSRGSEGLKQNAWLFRAHETLRKQEPAYARLAKQGSRSLGFSDLIALALSPESPVKKAVQANADVQRTFQLILGQIKQFPEDPDAWDWAMLRSAYPEEDARIALAVKKNELRRLEHAVRLRAAPLSGLEAYRQYWLDLIAGEPKKARAVLDNLVKQGGRCRC
jgi:hypothetical protein